MKTEQKKQQKQDRVRNAVANALCTAAVGATAVGCPGAQVRATPAPEACPAGSLEAMNQLGISTGQEAGAKFLGALPGYWLVRPARCDWERTSPSALESPSPYGKARATVPGAWWRWN